MFHCLLNSFSLIFIDYNSYPWSRYDMQCNIIQTVFNIDFETKNTSENTPSDNMILIEEEWIAKEEQFINNELNSIEQNPNIFVNNNQEFVTQSDEHFITIFTDSILSALQSIHIKLQTIVDCEIRFRFTKKLIIKLLDITCSYVQKQFPYFISYRSLFAFLYICIIYQ